jgi:hypothetical protein
MHPQCAEMGLTAPEELGRQQYLLFHLLNYSQHMTPDTENR